VFDGKLIQRATITGIILQLTLVIACHYVEWIRVNGSEFGGMMIATNVFNNALRVDLDDYLLPFRHATTTARSHR